MFDRDNDDISKISQLIKKIANKDLKENKLFGDIGFGERVVDLYDESERIIYEVALPYYAEKINTDEEVSDFIEEAIRIIDIDKKFMEYYGEKHYKVIWVFKYTSETLFNLLHENGMSYALIS